MFQTSDSAIGFTTPPCTPGRSGNASIVARRIAVAVAAPDVDLAGADREVEGQPFERSPAERDGAADLLELVRRGGVRADVVVAEAEELLLRIEAVPGADKQNDAIVEEPARAEGQGQRPVLFQRVGAVGVEGDPGAEQIAMRVLRTADGAGVWPEPNLRQDRPAPPRRLGLRIRAGKLGRQQIRDILLRLQLLERLRTACGEQEQARRRRVRGDLKGRQRYRRPPSAHPLRPTATRAVETRGST